MLPPNVLLKYSRRKDKLCSPSGIVRPPPAVQPCLACGRNINLLIARETFLVSWRKAETFSQGSAEDMKFTTMASGVTCGLELSCITVSLWCTLEDHPEFDCKPLGIQGSVRPSTKQFMGPQGPPLPVAFPIALVVQFPLLCQSWIISGRV